MASSNTQTPTMGQLETWFEVVPSGLIELDGQGNIVRCNHAAAEILGVTSDEVVGKSLSDLSVNWSRADWSRELTSSDHGQTSTWEIEFTDAAGSQRWLNVRRRSVPDLAEHQILCIDDVTAQRLMHAQLDQSQRLESVGQLAAGVAHEINTPMQYIGDNVRFVSKTIDKLATLLECLPSLADDSVSDEDLLAIRHSLSVGLPVRKVRNSLAQIPEALSDSLEGVQAVAKIVAAMKEFCHPGSDQPSDLCVNHIVESSVTVARNEWKYVSKLEMDLQADIAPVLGYPSELGQAILNIVVNASHAISDRVSNGDYEQGLIKVTTEAHDECVQIIIQDNGGGIPEKAQSHVFEPFFTTKDVGRGTGQGLAIARNVITQKHGGELTFEVVPGEGTTFTIRIPRTVNAPPVDVDEDSQWGPNA